MTSIDYGDESGTNYSEPFLELPETLVSGEVTRGVSKGDSFWKEEDGDLVEETHTGRHEIRIIGKEDVEVPAGVFSNCIQIEVVSEMISGGRFENEKYLMWYHPKVGMVKFEYLEGQDSRMELQEISIPEGK